MRRGQAMQQFSRGDVNDRDGIICTPREENAPIGRESHLSTTELMMIRIPNASVPSRSTRVLPQLKTAIHQPDSDQIYVGMKVQPKHLSSEFNLLWFIKL